jgi:N-acetylglucosamine-6-sulfatase
MRTQSLARIRRFARVCLILPVIALAVPVPKSAVTTHAQMQRPNILIIMTDDQSHDTLTDQFMPNTKSMIADQGVNFSRGFMSTALCCPSRSSLLTGEYARHHGVHVNSDQLTKTTCADLLHSSGYYTGLIGKYLNSWPGDARPEYNYWACWTSGYVNPRMNIFGQFQNVQGYLTYILRDYALDFLDKVPGDEPFFLLFTPHAPHAPATPAPGDEHLYSDLDNWRPPSFNPAEQPDKPQWLQDKPQLTPAQIKKNVDDFRLDQLRCLHSVDIAVRDVLLKLKAQGKLDNTFIVFYSDNGYFWGEHRLLHKNRVYEEASHGPFALRYPPLVSVPRTEDALIQVADLAPTMYELAGIPIPPDVDGKSLVPLLSQGGGWRDALLLEGWPGGKTDTTEVPDPGEEDQSVSAQNEHYQAVRTARYVYVETDADTPELYDLQKDKYQMNNVVNDSSYEKVVKRLRKRLHSEF